MCNFSHLGWGAANGLANTVALWWGALFLSALAFSRPSLMRLKEPGHKNRARRRPGL